MFFHHILHIAQRSLFLIPDQPHHHRRVQAVLPRRPPEVRLAAHGGAQEGLPDPLRKAAGRRPGATEEKVTFLIFPRKKEKRGWCFLKS